ncbi:MAG: DNA primase, partial [Gemmatimonadetes bacterium]|nr:DNA primase [Gemmatimonadota bacterium]
MGWAEIEDDDDLRKALVEHARRSEAEPRLRAMLTLAQSEPGVPVTQDQLDADPWLLNVSNGTLNLKSGELRPHSREDLITELIPIPYEADATCPTWETFLARVLANDQTLIAFLQRAIGY